MKLHFTVDVHLKCVTAKELLDVGVCNTISELKLKNRCICLIHVQLCTLLYACSKPCSSQSLVNLQSECIHVYTHECNYYAFLVVTITISPIIRKSGRPNGHGATSIGLPYKTSVKAIDKLPQVTFISEREKYKLNNYQFAQS